MFSPRWSAMPPSILFLWEETDLCLVCSSVLLPWKPVPGWDGAAEAQSQRPQKQPCHDGEPHLAGGGTPLEELRKLVAWHDCRCPKDFCACSQGINWGKVDEMVQGSNYFTREERRERKEQPEGALVMYWLTGCFPNFWSLSQIGMFRSQPEHIPHLF